VQLNVKLLACVLNDCIEHSVKIAELHPHGDRCVARRLGVGDLSQVVKAKCRSGYRLGVRLCCHAASLMGR